MEQEFKFYKVEFLNLQFIYKKYTRGFCKRELLKFTETQTLKVQINRSHIILLSIKIVNDNYNINNCFGKKMITIIN